VLERFRAGAVIGIGGPPAWKTRFVALGSAGVGDGIRLRSAQSASPELQKCRPSVFLEQIDASDMARSVSRLLCRLTSDSFQIEAPLSAADVRKPLRRLWPL
jgi:hypothetical protein